MNYLSILDDITESSASYVLHDGRLAYVFTEERYNRKKYYKKFPFNAIYAMSHYAGKETVFNCSDKDIYLIRLVKGLFPDVMIKEPIDYYHHLLHCYESFYTSGFKRAAVLVVDGYGSDDGKGIESISLYHKIGRETKLLKKYYINESLGKLYFEAQSALNFKINQEGHFMGLSSYGKPFEKRYAKFQDGKISIDLRDIEHYVTFDSYTSVNFAATIQRDLEECLLGLVKYIKELTGEENLCLSGGVFNNVLANNLICESGIFKNVWCSPAPGDYGINVGHAYLTYEKETPDEKLFVQRMQDAYLGEEYNDEMIMKFLDGNHIDYENVKVENISNLLAYNNIIAWFQGRSEYGRRALGHRSILCNPYYRTNYITVSQKIKNRASYRPLACTVPDELFDLMFDIKNKDLTEFMLRAIPVREEIQNKIKACLAVDFTTRPQNLHRNVNSILYDVIMDFYKKTDIPAIVNTSLNAGGEPIVESLSDLFLFCKKKQDINYIVLNGKFLVKNDINTLKYITYMD